MEGGVGKKLGEITIVGRRGINTKIQDIMIQKVVQIILIPKKQKYYQIIKSFLQKV